jgi:hypothetical protein
LVVRISEAAEQLAGLIAARTPSGDADGAGGRRLGHPGLLPTDPASPASRSIL